MSVSSLVLGFALANKPASSYPSRNKPCLEVDWLVPRYKAFTRRSAASHEPDSLYVAGRLQRFGPTEGSLVLVSAKVRAVPPPGLSNNQNTPLNDA